jgi:hypothetical protein
LQMYCALCIGFEWRLVALEWFTLPYYPCKFIL